MRQRMMWKTSVVTAAAIAVAAGAARADGDAERGAKRFEECASCHTLERTQNTLGPSLYGVFSRKAGALAEYRYSPAMKRSGITWTPEAVDAFIADPQTTVPANRMPYAGLTDPAARADLIAFLVKTFK
jgi:cytochrome c2